MAANIFAPFMVIGLVKKSKKLDKKSLMIFLFLVLSLIAYFKVPIKHPRYLFNLVLPISYFSSTIFKKRLKTIFLLIIFGVNLFLSFYFFQLLENPNLFSDIIKKLDNCNTRSNAWIYLNYLGFSSGPSPWEHQITEIIKEGGRLLLFYHIKNPNYAQNETFLNQFPVIEKTDKYIIIGNSSFCNDQEGFTKTYLELVKEACDINLGNYDILFSKKACDYIDAKKCPDQKKALCG